MRNYKKCANSRSLEAAKPMVDVYCRFNYGLGRSVYDSIIEGISKIIAIEMDPDSMAKHTHDFVEKYEGLVGFGADRETDEHTVIYYLQKFSDDTFIQTLVKRMTEEELSDIFDRLNRLLKNHLTEDEYHSLFLKD